jgi:Predicted dinucleotide-binding enzymes
MATKNCVIVGTGDMAHGLAHMFSCNSSYSSYNMVVTSPKVNDGLNGSAFHATNVTLRSFDEAIASADILILAIPGSAMTNFFRDNLDRINKDAVIVDVSNSMKKGENAFDAYSKVYMQNSGAEQKEGGNVTMRVVKAFYDCGAVYLLAQKSTCKTPVSTNICGTDLGAISVVADLAKSMGFTSRIVPLSSHSSQISHQNSLGNEWVRATLVIGVVFVLTEVYCIIRYHHIKGYPGHRYPLNVNQKAIGWTASAGFALSLMAGTIARIIHAVSGKGKTLSPTLVRYLEIRKHLGILSLFFTVWHSLMSMLLLNASYFSDFFLDKTKPSKMSWRGELSLFFATTGFMLLTTTGICSLPSVSREMTKKQWAFVFGPLVWLGFLCAMAHIWVIGMDGWEGTTGMPGVTLMSSLIPFVAIALKLIQMVLSIGQ